MASAPNVLAYEPLRAIGMGHTPSAEQIVQGQAHVRQCLAVRWGAAASRVRILYGGLAKPDSGCAILALSQVGGALVGGASLKGNGHHG
jgi:triosephosphate isomerase